MRDLDEQMEWAHKVLDLTDEEYELLDQLILQQKNTKSPSLYAQLDEEINAIFEEADRRENGG